MEYAVLNNGLKMPMEGIGTFLLQPAEAEESVYQALKAGYRPGRYSQRLYERERRGTGN